MLIQLDDDGLYVTELKNHVIIQQDVGEDQIYNGEEGVVLSIPAEGTVKDANSLVVESQVKKNLLTISFKTSPGILL